MAKSIQALRERRNALAGEVRNILDKNPGAEWKTEHQTEYDNKCGEIEALDNEIKREQRLIDLTADAKRKELGIVESVEPVEGANLKPRALFAKFLRAGDSAFTPEEAAAYRNTMSTTTGSEGGYTVQTEVASELLKALKAYGGMRQAGTVFQTGQGNNMNWPTMDDTGNVGELIAQNTTATALDPSFNTVDLNVFKYSSKIVAVPFELLQDSEIDIEATVLELLAERLGRITNTHFTVGTGGGTQPRGIVTAAALGKTGLTGQTLTVIYDDLVDLEHSVDPAYRDAPGVGFMMHDTSLKVVRKIKDSQGRPIFVPGYEQGSPQGAPATLIGRPITINQDIPVMAANAKSILFGRLKNYRIRDVMAATLFRFTDSVYTKLGQVGFLAWMRSGGNLLDVSGSTVKYYANSAT